MTARTRLSAASARSEAARARISSRAVEIAGRVVTGLGFPIPQPGRDIAVAGRKPGLPAAHRSELVGPGVLSVPRGLDAILGCDLAVVDGPHTAVRGLGTARVGASAFVGLAPEVARRAIAGGAVAITRGDVARFSLPVTQPGRNVAVAGRQAGFPAAHSGQLVRPRILAVLGGLRPIVCGDLAVVDSSFAAVRGIGAARVGAGAFVCRAPAIARRAITGRPVELARRVVTRLGVPVALLGGDVTGAGGQARRFAILGRLRAVFGRKPAIVDGLCAVVRGLGAPGGRLGTLVCRAAAVACGAVARGSVEVAGRVVASFGLPVAQPRGHVSVLRGQPRFPAARADQLVGPGVLAISRGLGAIFGRDLSVVDGLRAVVRRARAPRGGLIAFVGGVLPVGRRAIARGPVQVAGGVVTRFGLPVAQTGCDVSVLRSQTGLPAAHVGQLVDSRVFPVLGGHGRDRRLRPSGR